MCPFRLPLAPHLKFRPDSGKLRLQRIKKGEGGPNARLKFNDRSRVGPRSFAEINAGRYPLAQFRRKVYPAEWMFDNSLRKRQRSLHRFARARTPSPPISLEYHFHNFPRVCRETPPYRERDHSIIGGTYVSSRGITFDDEMGASLKRRLSSIGPDSDSSPAKLN